MTHDFDDDANTPNGAERPGDVPPGPPAPQPDGSPSDDAEVRATPQQLNISMELLVAMSAAAQQQLKASMEPLVAMSAAAQQQLKASMEPLVAISAAAQQQLKASMEPLVAISTAAQQQIEALAAQIDLPAVHQLSAWTKRYDEVFEQIAKAAVFEFPEIDLRIEDLDRWIPSNLHNLQGLGAVFSVALDEGIPFSWIPRPVTVAALVEAEGPQERLRVLAERRDDILDDCDAVLAPISHEWATACRDAIRALREDLYGSAQSHASNIIDSIVLTRAVSGSRDAAVKSAQRDIDDVPFRFTSELLTLRPLARAFTPWWPSAGTHPPAYFSRHTTSHAVGHAGVFKPEYALTAIMLAASLIVQFESHAPSDGRTSMSGSN